MLHFIIPLTNIYLTVSKGEFVTVMGPSGSGKSTLLNIIGTLDSPSSGVMTLFEKYNSQSMTEKQRALIRLKLIGFVFQSFNLIPFLSALENVELPLRIMGIKRNERIKKVFDILARVGLDKRLNHYPSQLSSGEQQRVSIARSLINDPELVLADEPTGNLDSTNTQEIIKLMKELCAEKRVAFLIVTHDNEITWAADRVLYLNNGELNNKT
ncbi:ABC transporter ATP-binding protein [Pelotomaculum terephthalicicum]|uniref:ABC transporter ATP-binding protein n=1 Tax=Pelotomaculum terephthalicicum TaxID=206393 RepID=UPI00249DE5DF|nr:ABC transporter ATP-binding protein [Pelotomaculum terephthalicicum]